MPELYQTMLLNCSDCNSPLNEPPACRLSLPKAHGMSYLHFVIDRLHLPLSLIKLLVELSSLYHRPQRRRQSLQANRLDFLQQPRAHRYDPFKIVTRYQVWIFSNSHVALGPSLSRPREGFRMTGSTIRARLVGVRGYGLNYLHALWSRDA